MPLFLLALAGAFLLARRSNKPAEVSYDDIVIATRQLYSRIADVQGWLPPPLWFTYEVANAASNGTFVFVNPTWVARTLARHCQTNQLCSLTAIAGVLAHELSHHFHQDAQVPLGHPQRRQGEYLADVHAGFVVASLGLDVLHFEQVLVDPEHCSDDEHGTARERIAAVREGAMLATLSGVA